MAWPQLGLTEQVTLVTTPVQRDSDALQVGRRAVSVSVVTSPFWVVPPVSRFQVGGFVPLEVMCYGHLTTNRVQGGLAFCLYSYWKVLISRVSVFQLYSD